MKISSQITSLLLATFVATISFNVAAQSQKDMHAVKENTCKINEHEPAAIFMQDFLKNKNKVDRMKYTDPRKAKARTLLVEKFIAPSHLSQHRVPENGATLNDFGSVPERIICIKESENGKVALTTLVSPEYDWAVVLSYPLIVENNKVFINPPKPPTDRPIIKGENIPIIRFIHPANIIYRRMGKDG